jgi:hypothetical protein
MFEWWEKPEYKFVYSPFCDNTANDEIHNERIDSIWSNKTPAKNYVNKKNAKLNPDKARYWVSTNRRTVRQ